MKKLLLTLLACGALGSALACTNFIITRGASTDGSIMISYAADSHSLYGELYNSPAAKHKKGSLLPIYEWDTGRYIGTIPQVPYTYSTIGNMNEHSLIIGETTYGGRSELHDPDGGIDYGSLIYITLQRAKTAREAIDTIVELANTHGYCSVGESFSIADRDEAWIMELIGKGPSKDKPENKGIVWVARRIPDGYICAHANQARITTFPLNDPENCLYSDDVIAFARRMGYYEGADENFSFCDAYAPLEFSAMRGCEARVWSFFRTFATGMDVYQDYAMGYKTENRMPLWIRPTAPISPKQVFDAMRDHYEGTPMDMTTDVGAGGVKNPYRWRPMEWEWEGKKYLNERATATQQTGFWFVAQARPDFTAQEGILWFGVDDAATSCLTPIYCSATETPECFRVGNGSMLRYSPTSAFWLFNRVTNFAYTRYDMMSADIRKVTDAWENACLEEVAKQRNMKVKDLTRYSVSKAQELFSKWDALDKYLLIKYVDGNLKQEDANGFMSNGNNPDIPATVIHPGYDDKWKEAVVRDNGKVLEIK